MPLLLDLIFTFAKIGVMTFGGGLAMLPMLTREVVEKKKWATEDELLDYYAIGQITPGIIAVNTATFVGRKQKGNIGGILATFGVVLPSMIIIAVISSVLAQIAEYPVVQDAFAGIRVCVCVLVFKAVIPLFKKGVKDILGYIIFGTVLVLSLVFDVSPVILVVLAGITGITAKLIAAKRARNNIPQNGNGGEKK